jgi:hypothetical protein
MISAPIEVRIRLHIKILEQPRISIATMIERMRAVFSTVSIHVEVVSTEELNLPLLNDLDVGGCIHEAPSDEVNELFQNRNNAGNNDIVIYFVRSVTSTVLFSGAVNGCAAHPVGRPGASVAQIASQWTLAHEVGHVLGLPHIPGETDAAGTCVTPDFTRLMTGCSTNSITGTPSFDQNETNIMLSSILTLET